LFAYSISIFTVIEFSVAQFALLLVK